MQQFNFQALKCMYASLKLYRDIMQINVVFEFCEFCFEL